MHHNIAMEDQVQAAWFQVTTTRIGVIVLPAAIERRRTW